MINIHGANVLKEIETIASTSLEEIIFAGLRNHKMKRQPTPQHITWFLDLYKGNQLILDPPYQRKSVWTPKDRRFFIDSIFRNYPTPPVFVYRVIDDNGFSTYNVVDGKQRLETIIQFAESKFPIDKEFGDANLNGKKFKDIPLEYKRKFWDYVLIVDFIDSIEGKNIEEVFDRVNRNAKNLQAQELRHARFDGWFIQEAENESERQLWWDLRVSTRAKDKRMKNVQAISELLLVTLENQIVGFSQDYLDDMYAKYDSPEETLGMFDEDAYQEKKERIIRTLLSMNEVNGSVSTYCKTINNLYTLWALISLNIDALPSVEVLAQRYQDFMRRIDELIAANTPNGAEHQPEDKAYFDYYQNSKGASTDLPQRTARLESLAVILA